MDDYGQGGGSPLTKAMLFITAIIVIALIAFHFGRGSSNTAEASAAEIPERSRPARSPRSSNSGISSDMQEEALRQGREAQQKAREHRKQVEARVKQLEDADRVAPDATQQEASTEGASTSPDSSSGGASTENPTASNY